MNYRQKRTTQVQGTMALEELSFQEDKSAAEIEQSMWMDEHLQHDTNRGVVNQAMDDITGSRVNPMQSTLNTEWSDISERQRNYYTRKEALCHMGQNGILQENDKIQNNNYSNDKNEQNSVEVYKF